MIELARLIGAGVVGRVVGSLESCTLFKSQRRVGANRERLAQIRSRGHQHRATTRLAAFIERLLHGVGIEGKTITDGAVIADVKDRFTKCRSSREND